MKLISKHCFLTFKALLLLKYWRCKQKTAFKVKIHFLINLIFKNSKEKINPEIINRIRTIDFLYIKYNRNMNLGQCHLFYDKIRLTPKTIKYLFYFTKKPDKNSSGL